MDKDALIARFRREADDTNAPYLWPDEDVTAWLDEAEQEASIRAHLLPERTNAAVCEITVTEGTDTYDLHDAVLEVKVARFLPDAGDAVRLTVVSVDGMDRIKPNWRDGAADAPKFLVQDEQTAILVPTPSASGLVKLEVNRLPLQSFEDKEVPEIGLAHHRYLVNWALFKAFSKPDAETIDPTRAAKAEADFNRYFGSRPDAQLGRDMRADQPHHNQSIW